MKSAFFITALGLAGQSVAFPAIATEHQRIYTSQVHSKRQSDAPAFDADAQRIDVSGQHTFVPPGPGDQRGPCPGLNALANHNYLPHNGVATIQQFVDATTKVFGMGEDLATFLSVYGAVMNGDLTGWSIGGPTSKGLPLGFLTAPRGISYSHNNYETDGSPTRGDLYQKGNAWDLQLDQWADLYSYQAGRSNEESNYDLDVLTAFRVKRVQQSVSQNPYFFNAPFSGIAVQPAAYTFIYRFMGNKSAEHPEGTLNKEVLKSFFAITGEEGSFQYLKGHEQIPDNWYRRAFGDEYTLTFYGGDLISAAREHPEFLRIGGNTGTVNSFTGFDPSDFSGGLYNLENLSEGNNAACYAFQVAYQFTPDFLRGILSDVGKGMSLLNPVFGSAISNLGCPQLDTINTSGRFDKFPGYTKLRKSGTY